MGHADRISPSNAQRRLSASLGSATIGAALLLGGCAGSRGGDVAYNPSGFGAPDAVAAPLPAADYRLGVGDVVSVRVYKVDSLSGDQTIDGAGRINLPLVGYVPAAGRTTQEMETELARVLGARYLTSPSVAVTLKSVMPKTITVDGSVIQPGVYPIAANTTLIKTIAMARGTAEGANPKRVVVFRQIDGQRMAAAFDLTTIRDGKDPDPALYADDIVVVDGSATSSVFKTLIQSLPFVSIFRPF